jgi:hypothetical protein
MSTVAKDTRRVGVQERVATTPRLTARGLARRIGAWLADDATTLRFTAQREHDQRLTRRGC